MTASPWSVLASLPDVRLEWTEDQEVLEGRRARWFPGHRVIVIDSRLKRLKARCSLAHELGHVVLEHPTPCGSEFFDNRVEVEADQFAARLLLPDLDLLGIELATSVHHGHAASNLNVTRDILEARLAGLREDESRHLRRIVWDVHEGRGA